jgi:hypothetical protein
MPSGHERGPGRVRVRYRRADGEFAETTLDCVVPADVMAGLPVREFRCYKGRQHYSGWYWSATMNGHVAYESRLELARIMLADFDPAVTGLAAQPFQLTGPGRHPRPRLVRGDQPHRALAISRRIGEQTGWSIRKFVRTTTAATTIEI